MRKNIPGLIKYEEAKKIHHNWLETRATFISKERGKEESYEVNFSAKELLDYLQYVVKTSKEQGMEDPGIRVLFGAYDGKENSAKKDDKTDATVVFVPTNEHSTSSACNKNLDALNYGNTGWPPKGT